MYQYVFKCITCVLYMFVIGYGDCVCITCSTALCTGMKFQPLLVVSSKPLVYEVMAKGWRRAGQGWQEQAEKQAEKTTEEKRGKIHGDDDGRSGQNLL